MMYTVIDAMMQQVTLRVKTSTDDGEGGNIPTWSDAGTFLAAITKHKSDKIIVAEHDDTKDTFNITTSVGVADLHLHDVIKDVLGRTYRITSESRAFPTVMSVQYKRYTAERWNES